MARVGINGIFSEVRCRNWLRGGIEKEVVDEVVAPATIDDEDEEEEEEEEEEEVEEGKKEGGMESGLIREEVLDICS